SSKTGCLLIAPDDLAFGVNKVGCSSRAKGFTVYNTCSTDVTLTGVSLQNGSNSRFTITKKPATPYKLKAGASVDLEASYRPSAIGHDVDAVALQTAELSHPYIVGVTGSG